MFEEKEIMVEFILIILTHIKGHKMFSNVQILITNFPNSKYTNNTRMKLYSS